MQADHQEKSRRLLIFDLFDQISNSGGTLIIGGDFFDFWFNYKNVMPSFYTDIIYELNKLNQCHCPSSQRQWHTNRRHEHQPNND